MNNIFAPLGGPKKVLAHKNREITFGGYKNGFMTS